MGSEDVEFIHEFQYNRSWKVVVKVVLDPLVPSNENTFLTSRESISF
jgi:hypothetical protein